MCACALHAVSWLHGSVANEHTAGIKTDDNGILAHVSPYGQPQTTTVRLPSAHRHTYTVCAYYSKLCIYKFIDSENEMIDETMFYGPKCARAESVQTPRVRVFVCANSRFIELFNNDDSMDIIFFFFFCLGCFILKSIAPQEFCDLAGPPIGLPSTYIERLITVDVICASPKPL